MATCYMVDRFTNDVYVTSHPEYHANDKKLKKSEREARYREQKKTILRGIIKPKDTIYCNIVSVSSSGMTRNIKLYIIDGGIFRDITYMASVVIGWKQSDKTGGLIVQGCGMDMCFHTVYTLGALLWPEGTPEPHGTRNGAPDNAGGYALKHSTI